MDNPPNRREADFRGPAGFELDLAFVQITCCILKKIPDEPLLHFSGEFARITFPLQSHNRPRLLITADPILDGALALAVYDSELRGRQLKAIVPIKVM